MRKKKNMMSAVLRFRKNLKMQTFLSTPKFDKQYVYKNPQNIFHNFTNAFSYYKMVSTGSPHPDKKTLCEESNNKWRLIKNCSKEEIENKIHEYLNTPVQLRGCLTLNQRSYSIPSPPPTNQPITELLEPDELTSYNATSQKAAIKKKKN
jgi:hypothetical protein